MGYSLRLNLDQFAPGAPNSLNAASAANAVIRCNPCSEHPCPARIGVNGCRLRGPLEHERGRHRQVLAVERHGAFVQFTEWQQGC